MGILIIQNNPIPVNTIIIFKWCYIKLNAANSVTVFDNRTEW